MQKLRAAVVTAALTSGFVVATAVQALAGHNWT